MDILAFDLSTKSGWACFKDDRPVAVGTYVKKVESYKSEIRSFKDIPPCYPNNIWDAATNIAHECLHIWHSHGSPYRIVVEHTEGSSHRISQRTLEWIHAAFFEAFNSETASIKYLLNSDWRRESKCYISQWPEFVKWNKEVTKAKKKATPNKAGARVAKIDNKIVSKMNAKKLSIHIAKTMYPWLANEIITDDIADAMLLGHAAIILNPWNNL